jgi:hypothetical protein
MASIHQNKVMRLVLFSIICGFSAMSLAQSASELADKRLELERRYQNFYDLLNAKDKQTLNDARFASEYKEYRIKQHQIYEKFRQEFVKNRKAQPILDSSKFEEELKAQAEQREIERKRFVRRKAELKKLEDSVGVIPPDIEHELY